MRVEQAIKYRCDGCGVEQAHDEGDSLFGWQIVSALQGGDGERGASEHYGDHFCPRCWDLMRTALPK